VETHTQPDGTQLKTRKLTKFAHKGNRAYSYSHHHEEEDEDEENNRGNNNNDDDDDNTDDDGDDDNMGEKAFRERMEKHKVGRFDNDDIGLPYVLPPPDERIKRVVHEDNKARERGDD
jgi:hypothetical protein